MHFASVKGDVSYAYDGKWKYHHYRQAKRYNIKLHFQNMHKETQITIKHSR